ncbi:MAG: 50S ribosomal protein L22 [Archaeoglobaceae archaeon]
MASVDYAYKPEDETKAARAMGYEMAISFKYAVEICTVLRGKGIDEAVDYLEKVMEKKKAVPMKKHNKKVGHKNLETNWAAGRYPQKAAKHILKVLKNLDSNAEYKGLDKENLVIVHAQAKKGRVQKRYTPRAFGRATPKFKVLTTVEFVAEAR